MLTGSSIAVRAIAGAKKRHIPIRIDVHRFLTYDIKVNDFSSDTRLSEDATRKEGESICRKPVRGDAR